MATMLYSIMDEFPRTLFVADLNVYSKGRARSEALREIGAEAKSLTHTPIGGEANGHPDWSLSYRLGWKMGMHVDTERINDKLISEATLFRPALVWIEKGNMIKPATLKTLKGMFPGLRLAAYSEDDMFAAHNRTRAFTNGLKYYDTVFTTKSYNADAGELPSLGAKRCVVVDKAYDPLRHRPIELSADERGDLGADVGFIGTFAPERGEAVLHLAEAGLQVRVWGNGWETFFGAHDNLSVEGRAVVNTDQDLRYTKAVAATKINLGFLRKANRDLQTDRSIEIPACGGFMLAERSVEHERLFTDGHEAVFFDTADDMVQKARHYLENSSEREQIAAAGRERVVADKHTHRDRMAFMLGEAMQEPS